jgi:sodium-dependent dicarboxylate transporter 2/3/5
LWIALGPASWASIAFLAVFIMTGIRTPAQVWAGSLGHPAFMLVLVFMLFDNCLRETGAIKSMSDWFITRKFTRGRPYLFLFMFFASNLVIGLFMQNVALAIMYVALTHKLCTSLGVKKGDSLYTIMMLGTVWGNAVNHIASPIAKSIPNIIIGFADTNLGVTITYTQWLMAGIPFAALMLVVIMIGTRLYNPDVSALQNFDFDSFKPTPLSRPGKIALLAMAMLFAIIVVPETMYIFGLGNAVTNFMMDVSVTAWAAVLVVVLCLIRVKDAPVMNFANATKELPVALLLFIAVVIFVGAPIGAESAGIIAWVGNIFAPVAEHLPTIGVVALLCLIAIILTNFLASTVVATVIFVMGTALLATPQISPMSMAFVMTGSFAACMGVLIPASTASTALYYGEHIKARDCLKINTVYLAMTLLAIIAMTPLVQAIFRGTGL